MHICIIGLYHYVHPLPLFIQLNIDLTMEDLKREKRISDEQLAIRIDENDLYDLSALFSRYDVYVDKFELLPAEKTTVSDTAFSRGQQQAMRLALSYRRNKNPLTTTYKWLVQIILSRHNGLEALSVCEFLSKKCT